MKLFHKYPFPCWIWACWDQIVHLLCWAVCSRGVRSFLKLHSCPVGKSFSYDGVPVIRMQKPGGISIGDQVTFNVRKLSNLAGISQRMILNCDSKAALKELLVKRLMHLCYRLRPHPFNHPPPCFDMVPQGNRVKSVSYGSRQCLRISILEYVSCAHS